MVTMKLASLKFSFVVVCGLLAGLSLPTLAQVDFAPPVTEEPPAQEPADLIFSPEYTSPPTSDPAPENVPEGYVPEGYAPETAPNYTPPGYAPSALDNELCGARNVSQQGQGYVVGDDAESPYVVVVPGGGDELLNTVRQCVVDAYQTEGGRGNYIRAGAFPNRRSAEQLSRHLRSLDVDARVVYSP
jgi:hypothetical protein